MHPVRRDQNQVDVVPLSHPQALCVSFISSKTAYLQSPTMTWLEPSSLSSFPNSHCILHRWIHKNLLLVFTDSNYPSGWMTKWLFALGLALVLSADSGSLSALAAEKQTETTKPNIKPATLPKLDSKRMLRGAVKEIMSIPVFETDMMATAGVAGME